MTETSTVLSEAFDTANEEGSRAFEPVPQGSYVAAINDATVGALKSGRGQAVNLTWEMSSARMLGGSSLTASSSRTKAQTQ